MAVSRLRDAFVRKWPWRKKIEPESVDPEDLCEETKTNNPSEFVSVENSEEEPREDRIVQQRVLTMFKGFFRVSSGSRLALKLYGSQKAVKEEQNRHMRTSAWIIHPLSSFR